MPTPFFFADFEQDDPKSNTRDNITLDRTACPPQGTLPKTVSHERQNGSFLRPKSG